MTSFVNYNYNLKLYWYLSLIFSVLLVLSNTIADRLIVIGNVILPSAVIVFPVTYIIGDVVTELWGYKYMQRLIVISLILNCVFIIIGKFAVSLPAPSNAENLLAYSTVFGIVPRVAIASILGFFFGSIFNAYIMDILKNKGKHNKQLLFRMLSSTIVGEFIDTFLFIGIVFYRKMDIRTLFVMMFSQFLFKVIFESLFSPVTIFAIKTFKKRIAVKV